MPTLNDAEAALAAAEEARETARIASEKATADAADLRARVKSGKGAEITAAQIAEADATAEHAALVHHGASAEIPALNSALKSARADEACDEVLAELPQLGQDVVLALQAVEAVLSPLVAAAERYDTFVETAVHRLQTVAPSARLSRRMRPAAVSLRSAGGERPHRPSPPGRGRPRLNPCPLPFSAPAFSSSAMACPRSTESL